jgi:DNA-binding transcriptional regulator YdaS (Cro superfamily)
MDQEKLRAALRGQAKVAEKLGVTQQSVSGWVQTGRVPFDKVIAIEALTGIPRHELRPDIYPVESVQ